MRLHRGHVRPSSPRWSTTCSTWPRSRPAASTISPAWFEMVDLFSALRGMFKPVLTNPDTALMFEEPDELPRLFTDDRKLSQILRNFICQRAEVHAARRSARIGRAQVDGDRIRFSVADTGIGIAPEHPPRRCSTTSRRSTRRCRSACAAPASGCRSASSFAELLGGRVAIASELGRGSRSR